MNQRRFQHYEEEPENDAPWLITFGDLTMLTLTFFVMQLALRKTPLIALSSDPKNPAAQTQTLEIRDPLDQARQDLKKFATAIPQAQIPSTKALQLLIAKDALFLNESDQLQAAALPRIQEIARIVRENHLQVTTEMIAPPLKKDVWQRGTPWEFGMAQNAALVRALADYGVSAENINARTYFPKMEEGPAPADMLENEQQVRFDFEVSHVAGN